MRRTNHVQLALALGLLLILVATFAPPAAQARVVPTFPPSSLVEPQAEADTVTVDALRVDGVPSLDGDTGEWAGLTPMHLDRLTASTIAGADPNPTTADLSADLRVAWTSTHLYLAATLADDVIVGNNSSQIWGDDAFEFGIRSSDTTHQFTIAADGRQADRGSAISTLTVMTRTVSGGWSLEVALPVAALGLTKLQSGDEFAFTWALWDDDLFTYPGQTHMFWQGNSTSISGADWGILSLSTDTYSIPAVAQITARKAGGLPALDGSPTEWLGLVPVHLDRTVASAIMGVQPTAADLSADLRVVWDATHLYFAAVIADDIVIGNNSADIWGDDIIELAIYVPLTGQWHQFSLCVDGRQADRGYAISTLSAAPRTIAGGWTLEVAIPVEALGLSRLVAGEQFPFTWGLWDDDLYTYPGQTHMLWQSDSTSTYRPDWGMLSLAAEGYSFPSVTPKPKTIYLPLLLNRPAANLLTPTLGPIASPEANPAYTLRWSGVPGATSYVLERATSPAFGDAIQIYPGAATEYIAASQGIATYHYRVKARSAAGDSLWSNAQAVQVRWEVEPNGEAVDATRNGPLQAGPEHFGVLNAADDRGNDYFYFDLTSARSVELWLTHMAGGQDFNLALRNASLEIVPKGFSGNPANADEHIATGQLPAGRYYVQVSRVAGDSSQPYHLWGAW